MELIDNYINNVLAEINRAPERIKTKLLESIDHVDPAVLELTVAAEDLADIYQYGRETFGKSAADIWLENVYHEILGLSYKFNTYPECKHLSTKSKMYRNIILGKYLIIYRIKAERIEVLRALHGSRSAKIIRSSRSIKM